MFQAITSILIKTNIQGQIWSWMENLKPLTILGSQNLVSKLFIRNWRGEYKVVLLYRYIALRHLIIFSKNENGWPVPNDSNISIKSVWCRLPAVRGVWCWLWPDIPAGVWQRNTLWWSSLPFRTVAIENYLPFFLNGFWENCFLK